VAAILEDNGPMMFPENGQPYCKGWNPPAVVPQHIADRLPAMLKLVDAWLVPAPAKTIAAELAQLGLHFWQPDRPQGHYKLLARDYLADLSIFPGDIVTEGIARYRRNSEWWPKISQLIAIMQPMLDQRLAQARRLRVLMEKPTPEPKRRRWADMSPEQRQAHDAMMAQSLKDLSSRITGELDRSDNSQAQ
jgi:hypothetical protein